MQRRTVATLLAALPLSGWAQSSSATSGSFPTRPVKLINPFAPGSPVDVVARPLAQKLQEAWGQGVVIDNRAGAGGALGAELVAHAPPDGYTLLVTSASTHVIAPVLRASLPYDAIKDFAPIALVAHGPTAIVVHPSVPARTLAEFVQYARANPGKIAYASSGPGTILHLNGELFAARNNLQLLHVPYKGAVPASTDLLAGQVQAMFDSIANAAPQVKAGKLRALAVLTPARSPLMPEVPTAAEQGFDGLEFPAWIGLFAPARTPPAVLTQITKTVREVTAQPDLRERYVQAGLLPSDVSGSDFGRLVAANQKTVADLVRTARIEVQ
ncbi:MAG: tripartite tricarboxylate transporter substrate binding protein [Variovorax sp.]|nr:tripartite tricarboxylate transporter substrate binding protein [Variovorax sp.]